MQSFPAKTLLYTSLLHDTLITLMTLGVVVAVSMYVAFVYLWFEPREWKTPGFQQLK